MHTSLKDRMSQWYLLRVEQSAVRGVRVVLYGDIVWSRVALDKPTEQRLVLGF